jgi:hypothetical protein
LVQSGVIHEIILINSRNLDATRDDLSVQLLPTILIQFGIVSINFAVVQFAQQGYHVLVQHRGKQLRMKGGMAETFLQSVALRIPSLRMDSGGTNLLLRWGEIPEGG